MGLRSRVEGAAMADAVSNGSAGISSSTRHCLLSAKKMHFTTGAAAVAPYPAFSRYAKALYGESASKLNAPNAYESFHGRLLKPWAVPVFPAIGIPE